MEYKIPTSPKEFTIDWTSWLPTGVTISTATHTLESGLTEDSKSNSTVLANIVISGGVAGTVYECTSEIEASNGRPYEQTWFLTVQKAIN